MINLLDKQKTEKSTAVILNSDHKIIGYLTTEHEEKGLDAMLDMQNFKVLPLCEYEKTLIELEEKEIKISNYFNYAITEKDLRTSNAFYSNKDIAQLISDYKRLNDHRYHNGLTDNDILESVEGGYLIIGYKMHGAQAFYYIIEPDY